MNSLRVCTFFTMHQDLISKIKEKKPLQRLPDSFVEEEVLLYLKQHPKLQKTDFTHPKSKGFKEILKGVRDTLNKNYGVFWLNEETTLESHSSTKERMKIYPVLYKKIFEITGIPTSILDLSCGLNPLSYPYMKPFNGEYIATELTEKDCETLKIIFKKENIKGKVLQLDLLKTQEFPKTDITFLFKILDILDRKGHKPSEELLKKIPSTWIVISFSTTTLRNTKMNYPRRGWIEQMIKRLHWTSTFLEFENESFYVIKK